MSLMTKWQSIILQSYNGFTSRTQLVFVVNKNDKYNVMHINAAKNIF